jgi:hypothetical protein
MTSLECHFCFGSNSEVGGRNREVRFTPPKADSTRTSRHVRKVPKADIRPFSLHALLYRADVTSAPLIPNFYASTQRNQIRKLLR